MAAPAGSSLLGRSVGLTLSGSCVAATGGVSEAGGVSVAGGAWEACSVWVTGGASIVSAGRVAQAASKKQINRLIMDDLNMAASRLVDVKYLLSRPFNAFYPRYVPG